MEAPPSIWGVSGWSTFLARMLCSEHAGQASTRAVRDRSRAMWWCRGGGGATASQSVESPDVAAAAKVLDLVGGPTGGGPAEQRQRTAELTCTGDAEYCWIVG